MNIDELDEIYSALTDPLKAAVSNATLPAINWENEPFDVVEGVSWLECWNVADSDNSGIGENTPTMWNGFLQVTINAPMDTGTRESSAIVKVLREIFKKGTTLVSPNGISVRIEKVVPASSLKDRGWYIRPVSVYYHAQTPPMT